ncbi:MAG: CHAP domain-containing protein [Chloroflexi bacterium]|nr:CHAP domain-containing protein [Chloroflexota bacterium]
MARRRSLAIFALVLLALVRGALRSHADATRSAESQLRQSQDAHRQAEQQLQAAHGDIAALQAQLAANQTQVDAVQQQITLVQQQANAHTDALATHVSQLLQQLEAARTSLAKEQGDLGAQRTAADARLTDLRRQLLTLQQQMQRVETQKEHLDSEIPRLREQVQQGAAAMARDQAASNAALVQIYKLSQVSALQLVLRSQNISDGLNRMMEFALLAQHDRQLLFRVGNEHSLLRFRQQRLNDDVQATEQLATTLQTDHTQLQVRAHQETAILTRLQQQLTTAEARFHLQIGTLDTAIAATRQRLARTQSSYAAIEQPLQARQMQLGVITGTQQVQLGQLEQTARLAAQRAAAAARAQSAAQALLQRLRAAARTHPAIQTVARALPSRPAPNPFPYGQCTWWALSRRPDLAGSVWGNAWQWASEARVNGRAEGTTPRLGAIAVFQPGVEGADWEGHVGYVIQVGSNGRFAVSEMNFYHWAFVDTRWAHTGWGVTFIYG